MPSARNSPAWSRRSTSSCFRAGPAAAGRVASCNPAGGFSVTAGAFWGNGTIPFKFGSSETGVLAAESGRTDSTAASTVFVIGFNSNANAISPRSGAAGDMVRTFAPPAGAAFPSYAAGESLATSTCRVSACATLAACGFPSAPGAVGGSSALRVSDWAGNVVSWTGGRNGSSCSTTVFEDLRTGVTVDGGDRAGVIGEFATGPTVGAGTSEIGASGGRGRSTGGASEGALFAGTSKAGATSLLIALGLTLTVRRSIRAPSRTVRVCFGTGASNCRTPASPAGVRFFVRLAPSHGWPALLVAALRTVFSASRRALAESSVASRTPAFGPASTIAGTSPGTLPTRLAGSCSISSDTSCDSVSARFGTFAKAGNVRDL